MSDMGGFVEGAVAGQQYAQTKEMFGLNKQETQLTIQEKDLAVQKSKALLETQQKMLHYMDGLDSKGKMSPTDMVEAQAQQMLQIGDAQVHSGMFEEGRKTMETATLMLQHNENIAKQQTSVKLQQLKDVTDILGAAEDTPRGWDQAKQMFLTLHPDEVNNQNIKQILAMPYKPGMVKLIQSGVMTAKDRALEEEAKAGTRARDAEANEHNYITKHILPLTAEKDREQIDHLRKAGADSLVPTDQDLKRVTEALLDPIGGIGGPVDKNTAASAALPIAQAMRGYIKGGMPEAAAREKAMKEARERGDLKALVKPIAPEVKGAVQIIDDLLDTLNKADEKDIDLTGMFGKFRRGEEYVGSKAATLGHMVGLQTKQPSQIGHQFESDLTLLQLELPKLAKIPGQFSKLKMQEIQTVVRGKSSFDTKESSRSSLLKLREHLTGEQGSTKPKAAGTGFNIGQAYKDAKGRTATYGGKDAQGNDVWR